MTQARHFQDAPSNTRPSPTKTQSEIQEAKRIDKMRAVCSSHRVSGSFTLPAPEPATGALTPRQAAR